MQNPPQWNLYQERVQMENVFQQRFNFFLIAYTLIVSAVVAADDRKEAYIVLSSGLVVLMLIGITVYRAFTKASVAIRMVYRRSETALEQLEQLKKEGEPCDRPDLEDEAMFARVHIEANQGWAGHIRVHAMLGAAVPITCCLSLIVWILLIANRAILIDH